MKGLAQYQQISQETDVMDADPHRLIQLLMEAVLERLNMAKGCIQRKDYAGKARVTNNIMTIIGSLRSFLNFDANSELCDRLYSLYEYMEHTLLEASAQNDLTKIDEVADLMRSIKEAWDAIAAETASEGTGQVAQSV